MLDLQLAISGEQNVSGLALNILRVRAYYTTTRVDGMKGLTLIEIIIFVTIK